MEEEKEEKEENGARPQISARLETGADMENASSQREGAQITTPRSQEARSADAESVPEKATSAMESTTAKSATEVGGSLFEDYPWRVLIVRPAARDLSSLELRDKQSALRTLSTLASGIWSGHDVKHLTSGVPQELSLYEAKFGKGARIIWTIGIDFIPLVGLYQQTIRVWAVDRSHDDAQRSIQRVCSIHRRGLSSVINRKLRSRVQRIRGTNVVLPKSYQVAPDGEQSLAQLERGYDSTSGAPSTVGAVLSAAEHSAALSAGADDAAEGTEQTTVRYPPAVEQEDAYNLVKFYTLERSSSILSSPTPSPRSSSSPSCQTRPSI